MADHHHTHAPTPARPDAGAAPPPSSAVPSTRGTLVLLCAAQLMLVLDITAMNVALPTVGADLGQGGSALTWVITAYVVTFGGLMLLGGRLADLLGHRRMLVTGVVVFTLASLLCGTATTWPALVGGRALQGAAAALLSPAALGSLTRAFHGAARIRALGAWAAVGTVGFVAGLVVGGALTSGPGWRWIFLANLPVGAAVALLAPRLLPPDGARGWVIGLDLTGALLATGTVALAVYGLTGFGRDGATSPGVLVALGGAALAAVALVVVERRHPDPLLAPRLIRRGNLPRGLAVMVAGSAGMLGSLFLGSLLAQDALGLSPLSTGLLFLPSALATMVSAHAAGHLVVRHGARPVGAVGFAVTAAGAALLAVVTRAAGADLSWGLLVPGLAIVSLGLGPVFVVATSSALAGVPDRDAGLASGIVNTGHEVGGALGLAAVAAALGAATTTVPTDTFATVFGSVAAAAALLAAVSPLLVPAVRPERAHIGHGH